MILVSRVPLSGGNWKRTTILMAAPSGRLLATSDLHISHRRNLAALLSLGQYPHDWLIVAGDVGCYLRGEPLAHCANPAVLRSSNA